MKNTTLRMALFTSLIAMTCSVLSQSATAEGSLVTPPVVQPNAVSTLGLITWTKCRFLVPGEKQKCGVLTVPENYSKPSGRRVRLPFVIFKSKSAKPKADPVVFVDGGPGVSPMGSLGPISNVKAIRENRDLIVLEPRGGPASIPSLVCDFDKLEQCYSKFKAKGLDVEHYNNVNTARDFEMLRRGLKLKQWNLYGISYGTTLSMYIMRAFPSGVRSVTLDSPTAPGTDVARSDLTSGLDSATVAIGRCKASAACNAAYPSLRSRLIKTMTRLEARPIVLTGPIKDILGDQLGAREFAQFALGQLPVDRAPAFIDAVSKNQLDRLPNIFDVPQPNSPPTVGYDLADISAGLNLSIYCGEMHYSQVEKGPNKPKQEWPKSVWKNLVPVYFTLCKEGVWPIKPIDRKLMNTVVSNIPTLVMLGALDPLTSEAEAKRTLAGLRNGKLITVRETGHTVTAFDKCAQRMMADFINRPNAKPKQDCQKFIPKVRPRIDL
jgi:pimeloyl-ACP methyl ester carboxylesterase